MQQRPYTNPSITGIGLKNFTDSTSLVKTRSARNTRGCFIFLGNLECPWIYQWLTRNARGSSCLLGRSRGQTESCEIFRPEVPWATRFHRSTHSVLRKFLCVRISIAHCHVIGTRLPRDFVSWGAHVPSGSLS